MPQALTTAGTAVCLGLAAVSCAPTGKAGLATAVTAQPALAVTPPPPATTDSREMEILQRSIIMW